MERLRIEQFKNRQKELARRIANEIGLELKSVSYQEYLLSAKMDCETQKIVVEKPSQICIPEATIKTAKYKHRVHVIIEFKGNIEDSYKKTIDFILRTQYFKSGNKIEYSVNPHRIKYI